MGSVLIKALLKMASSFLKGLELCSGSQGTPPNSLIPLQGGVQKSTSFPLSTLFFLTEAIGFSGGTSGKKSAGQCRRQTRVQSVGWEDALEEGMATHSSVLAWRIPMDRGAWWATVHRVTKRQTRLKRLGTHA